MTRNQANEAARAGWTPERRKRQAVAITRWRPWVTGGLKKGDMRSRYNALKHGGRSAGARELAAALTRVHRALAEKLK